MHSPRNPERLSQSTLMPDILNIQITSHIAITATTM